MLAKVNASITNPLTINSIYNAITSDLQWAWATSFADFGATARVAEHTHLKAQALTGNTEMGFATATGLWVDVNFRSAYLSLTQDVGADSLTLRADAFDNGPIEEESRKLL